MQDLTKAEKDALACSYASLILYDDNLDVSADNIKKVTAAAGLSVPDYYFALWEKGLAIRSVDDIISNAGSVSAAPAGGAAAPAGGAAAPAAEEKKEEAEDAEEGMGGLFGGSDSDEEGGGMGGLFGGSDSD
eukprot:TRINITY_DN1289_c0_g2_i1.p1 TRINITY_DN1289_c0_g2~~TRINITY_DN1289_c0_g2_i1.p1  ORF type:complete len:132 (-),score=56.81 TRINITY_DN1289_c0_g2_i1:257-652(-)